MNTTTNNEAEQLTKLRGLCETLRNDYNNEDASRARIVAALKDEKLGEDAAFLASYELLNFGPANDWNGHRSAGTKAARTWEARILNPALVMFGKEKARPFNGSTGKAQRRGDELQKELAAKYPQAGLTFGYIGNCEPWGDDRSWRFFTKFPHMIDKVNRSPQWGYSDTKGLPEMIAKAEVELEAWLRKQLGL